MKKKQKKKTTPNKEDAKLVTFGFKSKRHPGQLTELDNFKKEIFILVNSLKFIKWNEEFEGKVKSYILDVKPSPNVVIFADKSSNVYKEGANF